MHAQIVLPIPLGQKGLTYRVPMEMQKNIRPGKMVQVPIKNRVHMGVVTELHERSMEFAIKDILSIQENNEILKPWQLEVAQWMSEKYFAPLYKCLQLFLPKASWMPPRTQKKRPSKIQDAPVEKNEKEKTLTQDQENLIETLWKSSKNQFLIHGVTGSGKTEIYLQLADRVASEKKQSIVLVPEIALTPQLMDYFKKRFGQRLSVLHSRRTIKEREKECQRIREGEVDVILGSRSALFAPVQNLGLIILDEEHEWSYKQDKTPRYHAREVALKMGELTKAKIVLGSATPSIETLHATETGNLQKLSLKKRIGSGSQGSEEQDLPEVQLIDMREEIRKGNFSIFSTVLQEKLAATLASKQQAILFLNRRGNASSMTCRECGHTCTCTSCEVSLTHHRFKKEGGWFEKLICHHCGRVENTLDVCPKCGGASIKTIGIGTQRIESDLQHYFPTARILRADRDTTKKRESFEHLYQKLKNHEVDILIGTQMIGKGLDLPKVTLVGVILADVGLHIPDFRSTERNFQLLTQVAGRAGRAKERGEVIIQTYNPDHPSIRWAAEHDYDSFYNEEIQERKDLKNPPFSRIIKITFTHKDQKICSKEAMDVYEKLKPNPEKDPLSSTEMEITAAPAMIPKKQNTYRWNVFIQGENPESVLPKILPLKRGWSIDVDPMVMS